MSGPGEVETGETDEPSVHTTEHGAFIVRGLREHELQAWAEHTAACFAAKANPPSADHFLGHYHNDPHLVVGSRCIRVVIPQEDSESQAPRMLASVRCFFRTIWLGGPGGCEVDVGGIGEVCTHLDHLRKGFSKLALTSCLQLLDRLGRPVSMLHAASWVQPLYASLGWNPVSVGWVYVPVASLQGADDGGLNLIVGRLPDGGTFHDTLLDTLARLHAPPGAPRHDGTTRRDEAYWRSWVPAELAKGDRELWLCSRSGIITVAYGVLRRFPSGDIVLGEFAAPTLSLDQAASALRALLLASTPALPSTARIKCPWLVVAPLLEALGLAGASLERDDDYGWMYRVEGGTAAAAAAAVPKAARHQVWLLDAF